MTLSKLSYKPAFAFAFLVTFSNEQSGVDIQNGQKSFPTAQNKLKNIQLSNKEPQVYLGRKNT
jgi:hypothetical protein